MNTTQMINLKEFRFDGLDQINENPSFSLSGDATTLLIEEKISMGDWKEMRERFVDHIEHDAAKMATRGRNVRLIGTVVAISLFVGLLLGVPGISCSLLIAALTVFVIALMGLGIVFVTEGVLNRHELENTHVLESVLEAMPTPSTDQ